MVDANTEVAQSQAAALEADIQSLPGVRGARLTWSPPGRVTEIHVVAYEGKSAKQIVRDIQTLASATYGVKLDYRVVSVVQLGDDRPAAAQPVRPALSSVSWTVEGGRTMCRVELTAGEQRASGESRGPATTLGRLRMAAQAAAEALQGFDSMAPMIDVAEVLLTEAGGRRLAVVVLSVLSDRGEEFLAGVAIIRSDEADGVARAVLDAINRRLPQLRAE